MTACIYCGRLGDTRYGACPQCMGETPVISGKVPSVLQEGFAKYRDDHGYDSNNSLLLDVLNAFLGYGDLTFPCGKDGSPAETSVSLLENVSELIAKASDLLRGVPKDSEEYRNLTGIVRIALEILRLTADLMDGGKG